MAGYSEAIARYTKNIAAYIDTMAGYSEAIARYTKTIARYSETIAFRTQTIAAGRGKFTRDNQKPVRSRHAKRAFTDKTAEFCKTFLFVCAELKNFRYFSSAKKPFFISCACEIQVFHVFLHPKIKTFSLNNE
jgi:hypothetical protein